MGVSAWVETYFRLVVQLYGMAFVVLGVVAYVLPRSDATLRIAPRLWLLGTFGIAHGLCDLIGWERRHREEPSTGLLWLDLGLLIASYLALLEFGRGTYCMTPGARRLPPRAVHAAALVTAACVALVAASPALGVVSGARYCIGLPAALLTALSLLASARHERQRMHSITFGLRAAGVAFLVYGVLVPIVAERDPNLPAWLPTERDFVAFIGIPVQFARALCACVITVTFVGLVRQANTLGNADLLRVVNTLDGFVYRCKNDRAWTLLYITGGVEELSGYGADEFLGGPLSWGELIDARDAPRVWDEVQAALDARRSYVLSYRIRARAGTPRWVYERGHGVFDDKGTLLFLDGHVTNDTARMQTLADLHVKDSAIESSLNAVAMVGMDGKVRYVNRAFLDMWRSARVEDVVGRLPSDFMLDEVATQRGQQALLRDGRWQSVMKGRRSDGSAFDVHLLAHVVKDAAGEPVGTMASFIDVTEQVQLAEALQQERDFATGIVATAPVIILLLDSAGRIQHLNAYGAQLLGYSLDEVRGKDWVKNFVPEHERERIQDLFEAASGGVETRGNVNAVVTRSGEQREIEWNDQLMRDGRGNTTGLLAVGLDITERKRFIEALRANQKQLRDILDGMFALVGLFSIEGEVLEVNRAPLVAAGLEREAVLGKPLWSSSLFAAVPQSEELAREMLRRAAAGELVRRDLQINLGSGKSITLDAAFGPVRDEAGRVVRVVGSAVDVTAQRELERQRLQLEAQLRQSQKLEALGTLAGGIAHDFNNMLMAIVGNTELARWGKHDQAQVDDALGEIGKAARRAQDLVQRILAFSRRHDHTQKHISLLPVIEEALKLLRSTLPARVELQLHTSSEDLPVMADASQVHQVIMNLTTNAWHAIGDRPGKVSVCMSSVWIDSDNARSDLPQGRYVRIDVTDTGSGMSAATMERIFEPFFTTKPAGQGTGLGLSVAHGIMRAHRGAIAVESTPGQGTSFRVYFPAGQPGFAREEAELRPGPTRGAGEHILFVDDEPQLVAVAVRMLQNMGYRVTGHTNGEEALAAFQRDAQAFDVVVTDHNMPGMSGIELAQELAKTSRYTPVILLSGFLREDELQNTLSLGVTEIVMKPTSYQHLSALIRAMLDRSRAQRVEVA